MTNLQRDNAELIACPFCGAEDSFSERADLSSSYVVCNNCLARGPVECQSSDEEEEPGQANAIAAWNTRSLSPQPPAETGDDLRQVVLQTIKENRKAGESQEVLARDLTTLFRSRISSAGDDDAELRIVFDGPPSHESGRFVECETADGRSVNAGQWHERPDGLWELRIASRLSVSTGEAPSPQPDTDVVERVARAIFEASQPFVRAGCDTVPMWSEGQAQIWRTIATAALNAQLPSVGVVERREAFLREAYGIAFDEGAESTIEQWASNPDPDSSPEMPHKDCKNEGAHQFIEDMLPKLAALNASTPEIQRLRAENRRLRAKLAEMGVTLIENVDEHIAALKQDEENHGD